ncbi:MAG TPA: RtcB family protein [Terriglobales bacterium]|nr:RtcB family protein [Terriglobales bacterium]
MTEQTYNVIKSDAGVPIKAWTKGVQLEDAAREQLLNVALLPFIYKWVAAMPDVHWGIGATVGSVIPTRGAIIPAAVGVDIGCGMMAVQTSLNARDLPDNLHGIREAIEGAVPVGRSDNGGKNDRGAWKDAPVHHLDVWAKLNATYDQIVGKYPKLAHPQKTNHLGTLGTGNHFIEVCLDESETVWFLLHSGSRGVGNRFGTFFIELAKNDMRQWMINVPDKDLAYLPQGTEHFDDYVRAVHWAQNYALANRELMMRNLIAAVRGSGLVPAFATGGNKSGAFSAPTGETPVAPSGVGGPGCPPHTVVSCHHNYVTWEHHYGENVLITRKGAVRAREGDMGIIPGSMGARSYIVRGKGNPESFMSCSHGAGRAMSRTEAKRRFTLEDHAKATAGVECRKDADVIDETPMAYKSIDAVMEAQKDLVDIVHTLRQVVCVKG